MTTIKIAKTIIRGICALVIMCAFYLSHNYSSVVLDIVKTIVEK